MYGQLFGNFLTAYTLARNGKQEREEQEKAVKAQTTLAELALRKAQREEQERIQKEQATQDFYGAIDNQLLSETVPLQHSPMTLTEMLAEPDIAIKALKAGVVNAGDLQKLTEQPKEPGNIAELRALMADPKLMEAAMAMRRAGASSTTVNTGDGLPKPEAGMYRPDPNKPGLLPEPGGEIERQRAEAAAKQAAAAQASASQGVSVTNTVDQALKLVGPMTAGLANTIEPVKGTAAYDLSQSLATIKANLGFDQLQQMRANSPTGGALGAVAVAELNALQSVVASLDQGQSPKKLRENLEKIKDHYGKWQEAVRKSGINGNAAPAGNVIDFNSLPK